MDAVGLLKSYLVRFGETALEGSTDLVGLDGQLISREDEGTLLLDVKEQQDLRVVLDELHRRYSGKGVLSRREVERIVQGALFAVVDPRGKRVPNLAARVTEAVQGVVEDLRKPPAVFDWWTPVRGLDPKELPRSFANVQFCLLDEQVEERMRSLARERRGGADSAFNEVLRLGRESPGWNRETILMQVAAVDLAAADELAVRHATTVVDVLNYFADLLPYHHGRVYMPGWASREVVTSIGFGHDGHVTTPLAVKGPSQPYSITTLRDWEPLAESVSVAEELISAGAERSEFDETLLAAMSWAGRATIARGREEAFLLFAIACEALMLPEGDARELGYRLGLRTAFFIGSGAEDRRRIVESVKGLYGIRSRIVHSGRYRVSDEEVHRMRVLAKRVVNRALLSPELRSTKTKRAAGEWFESRIIA